MEAGSHKCNICSESFTTKEDLDKHSFIHTGGGLFFCNICNQSISRVDVKRHSLIHRAEKPHVCNVCNKSFARKGDMKRHLLVHSRERSHVCKICDKAFIRKGDLKEHSYVHSGKRPRNHVCSVCNKSFTRLAHLEKHSLLHNKKPLQTGMKRVLYTINANDSSQICSVCNKVFAENTCVKLLFSHQSEKNPYACQSCLKDFIEKISSGNLTAEGDKEPVINSEADTTTVSHPSTDDDPTGIGIGLPGETTIKEEIDDVKEEHNIDSEASNDAQSDSYYKGIGEIKKECDLDNNGASCNNVENVNVTDCNVTDDIVQEDKRKDSSNKNNNTGPFEVIFVDVKMEPNVSYEENHY